MVLISQSARESGAEKSFPLFPTAISSVYVYIETRLVLVWDAPWCRIESTGNSVELWDREYSGLWFYPGEKAIGDISLDTSERE
ncbi:hypothetical protein PV327_009513 [Microctonus hyperodae]|uniref:Uncharacterized protein n=1 Tax=Microctonus hyperodae TaxID=165561 RepID=A0AA39FTY5_MICHY|nr:hypothetical protein PV327_009513 [Microctonus hyperodae]